MWTLTFVQQYVTRDELEFFEHFRRKIHTHDVAQIESILEHVGYSEVGPDMVTRMPVRVPLTAKVDVPGLGNGNNAPMFWPRGADQRSKKAAFDVLRS